MATASRSSTRAGSTRRLKEKRPKASSLQRRSARLRYPIASRLRSAKRKLISTSTQTGNFLWQVHTINLVGYAAPKFYQINTATDTVVQSDFFYGTSTSYDFNASIAANSDNDIFVTWSMTDPARGTNAQVRSAGFDHNNGSC